MPTTTKYIAKNKGHQFDPEIADIMLRLIRDEGHRIFGMIPEALDVNIEDEEELKSKLADMWAM